MSETQAKPFRRKVFYIPGYDPFPARRYRELYRKEGAAQAAISGHTLNLSPGAAANWTVGALVEGRPAEVWFEVLGWSDLVQGSMRGSIPATYLAMVRTAWTYIKGGAFQRLMWLRRGPVLAALYPIAVLLIGLLVAIILGSIAGHFVGLLGVPYLHWLGFLPVAAGVLWFLQKQDRHLYAYYLMHDYAWTCHMDGAYPETLSARIADFAGRIAAARTGDFDEVLVIGHSSGAILAVSALADTGREGATLSLMTLGEVIPMMSFLPEAKVLRRDLHALASRDDIFWLDVTAPGDPCSFALADPVAVSGVKPALQTGPLVLSAAFTQTLSPARWQALRWRFFRLHFQYLCAFDRPGDYDYFRITAGAQTLRARFKDTAQSPNRIDVVASKHNSMAR